MEHIRRLALSLLHQVSGNGRPSAKRHSLSRAGPGRLFRHQCQERRPGCELCPLATRERPAFRAVAHPRNGQVRPQVPAVTVKSGARARAVPSRDPGTASLSRGGTPPRWPGPAVFYAADILAARPTMSSHLQNRFGRRLVFPAGLVSFEDAAEQPFLGRPHSWMCLVKERTRRGRDRDVGRPVSKHPGRGHAYPGAPVHQ